MDKTYQGEIKARVIDLRFAASGKLSALFKKRGEIIKKGELIAALDKKQLQTELDRELADYEKVRADFEIYNLQKGEPTNDIAKYSKSQKQAELNISVKQVELAKAKLDLANLISPIEGILVDDSDLVVGMNITPASNPITIIDTSSYYFVFEIEQENIPIFLISQKVEIKLPGVDKSYSGNTVPIFPSKGGKFFIEVKLDDNSGLLLGLSGQATIAS